MTETIIIKNPSPKLLEFLEKWKKKQHETLERAVEKYRKQIQ